MKNWAIGSSAVSGAILGIMTAFNSSIGTTLFDVTEGWAVFWTALFCIVGAVSGGFTGLLSAGWFDEQ